MVFYYSYSPDNNNNDKMPRKCIRWNLFFLTTKRWRTEEVLEYTRRWKKFISSNTKMCAFNEPFLDALAMAIRSCPFLSIVQRFCGRCLCWFLVAANTVLGWPMRLNCGALAQFWLDVFLFISLCCCANGPLSAIWIQCRAFLMHPLHFFLFLCPDSLHVCGVMCIRR